jgi:uncharacterized protein (TIGR03643 family)
MRNQQLIDSSIDRIIEMAWEDRTPFEAITAQFGVSEGDVIVLMRRNLKSSSFKRWRERVNSGVSKKHLHLQPDQMNRFKCTRQKTISANKIAKR